MDHFFQKWKRSLFLFGLTYLSFHSILMAKVAPPPSFEHEGKTMIYVDFHTATYDITYDFDQKKAYVVSKIDFTNEEKGHPLFDLVAIPDKVKIDGAEVEQEKIQDPHRVTSFRYVDVEINPGRHELIIHHQLQSGVDFVASGVRSGFFMADLSDRNLLEKYLPSNFEFDQLSMIFHLHFISSHPESRSKLSRQVVMSNAQMEKKENSWTLTYPAHFTSSSPYFHTFPAGTYHIENFNLTSKLHPENPRITPVTIYTFDKGNIALYKNKLISVFHELESDYGPWPHPQLVVYGAGTGGMEYCGATITSLSALGHEMTHSYFARGVMPANGNAGWIDEAVASWRDSRYPQHNHLKFAHSNFGGHSPYRRSTDREAYTKGAQLLGHIDYLFSSQGGLKKFLSRLIQKRNHTLILNHHFETDLTDYFSSSFEQLFQRYVYGTLKDELTADLEKNDEEFYHPFHPPLTEQDLKNLL